MLNTNVGFADCHIYFILLEGQRMGNPKSIYGWRLSLEKNIRVGGNQPMEGKHKTYSLFCQPNQKASFLFPKLGHCAWHIYVSLQRERIRMIRLQSPQMGYG